MNMLNKLKMLIRRLLTGKVFYVNGSDTLPPPLTRQEEEEVFLRLEGKDPAARKYLIEHNLRLVVYIAKKFETSGVGIEDLVLSRQSTLSVPRKTSSLPLTLHGASKMRYSCFCVSHHSTATNFPSTNR